MITSAMLARRIILPEFATLCFHNLTNPFSRNSFLFTSIQIPRGVTSSTLNVSSFRCAFRVPNTYPTLRRANPFVYNGLPPLWVSWPSFASPDPLFSIVCSLFCQNVGVGYLSPPPDLPIRLCPSRFKQSVIASATSVPRAYCANLPSSPPLPGRTKPHFMRCPSPSR